MLEKSFISILDKIYLFRFGFVCKCSINLLKMEEVSWESIGLSLPILTVIKELNFTSLTPVQAACIPLFLKKRKDVAVEAVTGSGKTLAFLIPVLEVLLRQAPFKKHDVAAIIISPTRELASQTAEITSLFLKHLPQFTSILLIGGNPVETDISKLLENGANIIIATPGRLADLFTQNTVLKLSGFVKTLEILILDEADCLLDMGFENTLNSIFGYLPKQRQTGLFSATQTKEMVDLIRAGLRNPVCITVKEKSNCESTVQRTPSSLSNFYMVCEADRKFSQLIAFLQTKTSNKCMVFFSTCASVDYFSRIMKSLLKDMPVIRIHGRIKNRRHDIFSKFKNYESGVLLCTDVMARGVDIPDVHWVIQFDPPSSASDFVHRCGRTARIGKTGNALLMLLPNEESFVDFVKINQKVELEEMHGPDVVNVSPKIKKMAVKDRDIYQRGLQAFVSFIRFYTKHDCTLLFRVRDLDFGKLANGYGLLKLPKMPELRNKIVKNFEPVDVDYEKIPFLDKHLEKMRQCKLKRLKENPQLPKKYIPDKKKRLKELKDKKQLKKGKKRKAIQDASQDIEDFARDARLLKKFKRGKISKEEFDVQFAPDVQKDFEDT